MIVNISLKKQCSIYILVYQEQFTHRNFNIYKLHYSQEIYDYFNFGQKNDQKFLSVRNIYSTVYNF